MTWFNTRPITRKLTLIILLTSSIALLAASAAFVVNDVYTYRGQLERELRITAEIIGSNSSAALQFGDPESAEENLRALTVEPHALAAYLFTADGTRLASYLREDYQEQAVPEIPDQDTQFLDRDAMAYFYPIMYSGEHVGTMYLRFSLEPMYVRLQRYAGIVALILIVAIGVALLISMRLKRIITWPILSLVDTTKRVSSEKDYSIRAAKQTDDELGLLVTGFNEMLSEIETRDAELETHRHHLAEQVAAQTAELRHINAELVLAKDRAEEASRLKSALLNNLSHEFRTPIAGILGIASVLQAELEEEHQEFMEMIEDSGKRLMTTLNAVLNLARLEANDFQLAVVPVDCGREVSKIVASYQRLAKQKGLTLTCSVQENLPLASLDLEGVDMIVQSLLSNAVKFTEEGEVSVRVTAPGDAVRITVRDTGIGIGAGFLPFIYEPFKQESTGLARTYEGTGIGLAIAKRMVDRMKGRIHVRSTVGEGSLFSVCFRRDALAQRTLRPVMPKVHRLAS